MEVTSHIMDLRPNLTSQHSIFDFERDFNSSLTRQWMLSHRHQAFYYIGLYLTVVFCGRIYMEYRSRFELKRALAVWNILLATFSIIGLCRTLPEFAHAINEFGFSNSVCSLSLMQGSKGSDFWIWIFTLAKVPELMDTLFIVLRKQKLLFLHWYHHTTVLLFSWYAYSEYISPEHVIVVMNFLAHSAMYTYYAMKAMHIKVPPIVPFLITILEILQMVAGFCIAYFVYVTQQKGAYCHMPDYIAHFSLFMYGSYLALFVQFFYNNYVTRSRKDKKVD